MAGGMRPKRDGLTLAERSALSRAQRSEPPAVRHCWVTGLPDVPGRWPGLLTEWAQRDGGGWYGRVVYAVEDNGQAVVVQAWMPAEHLEPTKG